MNNKQKHYQGLDLGSLLKTPGIGGATARLPTSLDPITRQKISVNLTQLQPFELNPRRSRNPKYDDIKASIQQRGLDAPPPISRRPGDELYVIVNGGNTRLAILNELWEETRDRRFYEIECDFIPWVSDAYALTGHLIENDQRGEMTFIDRARAVQALKLLWERELEEGETLSQRELARRLTAEGYRTSQTLINRIFFTLDYLEPNIPEVLGQGLGKHQIERLIKLRTACQQVWQSLSTTATPDAFAIAFDLALSECDRYADDWNYEVVQDEVLRGLANHLEVSYRDLVASVEQVIYQDRRRLSESLADDADDQRGGSGITSSPIPSSLSSAPSSIAAAMVQPTVVAETGATSLPVSEGPTRTESRPCPPSDVEPATTEGAGVSVPTDPVEALARISEQVAILVEDLVDPINDLPLLRERLRQMVIEGIASCGLSPDLLYLESSSPLGFRVKDPETELTLEQMRFWWLLRLITEDQDTSPQHMAEITQHIPWTNPLMLLFPDGGWAPMASAAALEVVLLARRCRAEWQPA